MNNLEKREYVKLENYITITKGKQLNKDEMISNGKYPVINGGVTPIGYFDEYNEPENTITVSQGGSAGFVDFQRTKFWASAHCYILRPKNEEVLLNKYLYYFLKNQENFIKNQASGVTLLSLSEDSILNLKITLPDIKTQEKIVEILDLLTDYSQELTAELTARKKQYSYYRNQLLNTNYLTDIKRRKLKDVASFERGQWKIDIPEGTKYPVVSSGTQVKKYTDIPNRDKNSITVASSGAGAGFVAFWDTPIYASNCFTIHANEEIVLQKYLFHFLKNKQEYIHSLKSTGGIPNIYSSYISDIEIIIPSFKIQQKIVDVLDNFEQICEKLNIGLPAEIEIREKEYQYYRNKLLTFVSNIFEVSSVDRNLDTETWTIDLIKLINFVFFDTISNNLEFINYVELEKYINLTNGKKLDKDFILIKGQYPVFNSGIIPMGFSERYNEQKNTITISQVGSSLGYVGFRKTNFWANPNCYIVKTKDESLLLNKYLYYFLKNQEYIIREKSYSAGIPMLARETILNLKITLPNIQTQQKIVDILDTFEQLTSSLNQGLPAEIELVNKQYQYYRNLLLTELSFFK
ncbi:restriction endonuclease subunit S [Mycoplasma sp. 3686d]|uniref:restriction endonuclease subunit S n=1 Tax=Mycoplasma sp. 3686d TaxID=2967300 RepID=UPI00211C7421|nr:restriction endonuclease subunit S [Mycoplasma sp. 3686d]UUM24607.1 restriction endonuclease subunit S [Mycoplasma sp. 3686d]